MSDEHSSNVVRAHRFAETIREAYLVDFLLGWAASQKVSFRSIGPADSKYLGLLLGMSSQDRSVWCNGEPCRSAVTGFTFRRTNSSLCRPSLADLVQ